jgi:hypothetical protein
MADDTKDEFDPAEWFAKQFGAEEPAPTAPTAPTAPEQPAAPGPPATPAVPPPLTEPPAAPPAPTLPVHDPHDQPTQAMAADQFGADLLAFRAPMEPPPVEPSVQGATEVMSAHELGMPAPEAERLAHDPLDALFGETQFQDYLGEPLVPAPTRRQPVAIEDAAAPPPRAGIPRTQKVLLSIAGGLVGVLALIALFLVGTRISTAFGPSDAVTADPTPSAEPTAEALAPGTPITPVAPGVHLWSELQGGECLEPYESPWQDEYTVVDCTQPHAGQMVARGQFEEIDGSSYPGLEELASRINLLCSAPTVIDYAVAGTVNDIQVAASFAADVDEWNDGNRSYSCFVSRAGGAPLTASVGVPQVVPTPPATPAP